MKLDHSPGDGEAVLDASDLCGLHPLFAVRVALWLDRLKSSGVRIAITEPRDRPTRRLFRAFRLGKEVDGVTAALPEDDPEVILRPTRLAGLTEVDLLADMMVQPLVDHFDDAAIVRDAVLMAISELCQNAVEHGTSPAGCVVAASRGEVDGISKIMLGVGDLGIGIPNHIRKARPELVLDEHAIGQALKEGVSGTQRGDRGYGFSWVLNETLSSAATSAEMLIRFGGGMFRREIVDARIKDHGWRAPDAGGTWIACDWATLGELPTDC
ncbi:MAG TPA: hypothetical protein VHA80_07280 [Solirubrobacterales bacterium]|nr:hypothetical protein [Solirubrobacterales bacterium]